MENTTIDQLVAKNIDNDTDPRFAGFISTALQELMRQQPDVDPESLIQDATEMAYDFWDSDRKSTRLNSSHIPLSRMPSSA